MNVNTALAVRQQCAKGTAGNWFDGTKVTGEMEPRHTLESGYLWGLQPGRGPEGSFWDAGDVPYVDPVVASQIHAWIQFCLALPKRFGIFLYESFS